MTIIWENLILTLILIALGFYVVKRMIISIAKSIAESIRKR